jgi:hypothetical protein
VLLDRIPPLVAAKDAGARPTIVLLLVERLAALHNKAVRLFGSRRAQDG